MLLGYDTKPPKQKIALLLPDAQYQTIEVYNTFSFTAEAEGKFESVIEKFNACCNPKKNETYERYVFHSRKQLQGEPVEQFVADLKLKAQTCQFDNLRDSMIRDRLVLGVSSQRVRKRLLRQEDLGLDKAVKICQAAEAIEKQILTLAQKGVSSSDTSVNYCNKRGRRQQQRKPFQPSTKQKPAPSVVVATQHTHLVPVLHTARLVTSVGRVDTLHAFVDQNRRMEKYAVYRITIPQTAMYRITIPQTVRLRCLSTW